MISLPVVWFVLIGILFAGYSVLDGFDLGVGFWSLFVKKEEDRRTLQASIVPFWDGNEVWLLAGGGALFAAFPPIYAAVFSGFYLALMLLLLTLIARAVSIEFRNQVQDTRWKRIWDWTFAISSTMIPLLLGVALGNLIRGLPLDGNGNYTGGFWDLLNPFSLAVGLGALLLFAMHGEAYLQKRLEGTLRDQIRTWGSIAAMSFAILFVLLGVASYFFYPRAWHNLVSNPGWAAVPLSALLAIGGTIIASWKKRAEMQFVCSALSVLLIWGTIGLSLFPFLVPGNPDPFLGLTCYNSCSSPRTLLIMFWAAVVGMPLVLFYTAYVYRVFRGKTKPGDLSY